MGCLVNAAGIAIGGPLTEHTEETIDKILKINVSLRGVSESPPPAALATDATAKLNGTIFASQLAIAQMQEAGTGGAIVNFSSIGGHGGIPGQQNAVYCASKGGILAFTKSLAAEYAGANIRVNSVSPGFVLTKMTPGYLERDVARLELFEGAVPLGRFADRCELKAFTAFLLTDAASYVTGEDIAIDGGVLAN